MYGSIFASYNHFTNPIVNSKIEIPSNTSFDIEFSEPLFASYPEFNTSAEKEEEPKEEEKVEKQPKTKQTPQDRAHQVVSKRSRIWEYKDKNQFRKDLAQAYRNAGVTNENMIRALVAKDSHESGNGRSAQGAYNYGNLTTGSNYKGDYVIGNDSDGKGNPIKNKFRSYKSIDEYARDAVSFLTRLYDFNQDDDVNTFLRKLQGGNKGGRRYAGDPNYIQNVLRMYNSL